MKKRIACFALALVLVLLSVPTFVLPTFAEDVLPTAAEIDSYIEKVKALEPDTDYRMAVRNKMLVYFTNLKVNFATLSKEAQHAALADLENYYSYHYEDYLYGEVANTPFVMTFGIMSDTHISTTDARTDVVASALNYMKDSANFAAAFITGDLSDNGVSPTNPANTDLDNFFDFMDRFRPSYIGEDGNLLPIINILGNHDVRGPYSENYPTAAYKLGMDMYLAREGLTERNFDRWINGYHFIMVNPSSYHKDDCNLTTEDVEWLDEKLSENEDGRPVFVMIHQPIYRIHTPADSPYTFSDLMARHPSAVICAGHTHLGLGENIVTQEGRGNYVGIPAIVSNTGPNNLASFYIAEVYEGGVIFRGHTKSGNSWKYVEGTDVIVRSEEYFRDNPFSAGNVNLDELDIDGDIIAKVEASNAAGGKSLVLNASGAGSVTLDIPAVCVANGYAAYALYLESAAPVGLVFNRFKPAAGATYYVYENGQFVEKTVDAEGKITANGWVLIPADVLTGSSYPAPDRELTVSLTAGQTVSLARVTYDYSLDRLLADIDRVDWSFRDAFGNVLASGSGAYGMSLPASPAGPARETTVECSYTFVGWDIDGDGKADTLPATLTDDLTAVAVYTETAREYTYSFYGADGTTLLSERKGLYGGRIISPSPDNLFGWDIDGDGVAEELPERLSFGFRAVAVLKQEGKNTFTFKDSEGHILKTGQVGADEKITVPAIKPDTQKGLYFVGWDTNGDGAIDTLPADGRITADLTARAIMYDRSIFDEFFAGSSTVGTSLEANTQSGVTVLTREVVPYAAAPNGQALKVVWDGTEQTINTYIKFDLPYNHDNPTVPEGVAFWISAPEADGGYSFGLFKNWDNANTNDYIYFLATDGTLTKNNVWRHKNLPAGFEGWVIMPMTAFQNFPTITENDYIRFAFSKSEGKPAVPQSTTYFGSAITYSCETDEMIKQLRLGFCSFTDIDGSLLGSGVVGDDLVIPENPTRADDEGYSYEFAGWDVNGDGQADDITNIPATGITARAVYNMTPKKYTYRFVDSKGTVLLTREADYGSLVLPPFGMEMKYEDEHYSYVRTYADYKDGMTVEGNRDYLVNLDATPKHTYTVEFYVDGVLLEKQELGHGALITPPALPEKDGKTGTWSGYTEGMTATSNLRFDANYGGGCGGCGASVGDVGFLCGMLLLLAGGMIFYRRRRDCKQ